MGEMEYLMWCSCLLLHLDACRTRFARTPALRNRQLNPTRYTMYY